MATRSTISIIKEDKTVLGSYCHWDGYLENNGKILVDFYNTEEKVLELISLGDLSSLANSINETVAYARDRNEELRNYKAQDFKDLLKDCSEEFNYFFDVSDCTWYYTEDNEDLKKVKEFL